MKCLGCESRADRQVRIYVMHGWTRVPCFYGVLSSCFFNTELSALYPVPGKTVKHADELFMPMEVTLMVVCNFVLAFSIEEGKAPTGREHELRDSRCPGVKPSHTLQW